MTTTFAGTPRYFAWLYSGAPLQAILEPLFGIEAEINAALQPGLEHSVAHVRMNWWAEEAERLRAGQALHPLTRALLAQRPATAAGGYFRTGGCRHLGSGQCDLRDRTRARRLL